MDAVAVTVTPDLASEMLAHNRCNRPLKRGHLSFLCSELKNGRWKFNGDAIRVAADGTLLDGQHRLEAVRQTGIPIRTLLVRGLGRDVFDTIDTGSRRSAADALSVLGEKSARVLAAALILADNLMLRRDDFSRSYKISNAEVLEMLERYPDIRDSMRWAHHLQKMVHGSISAATHYVFSRFSRNLAEQFFQSVASGDNLAKTSPALLLRNRLFENSRSKSRLSKRYVVALFLKAWRAYRNGLPLTYLRFREEGDSPEPFPWE